MRRILTLLIITAGLLILGSNAMAQGCPSGSLIQIRFANVDVNCINDSLYVDVQVSNPTATAYSVGSMSLRFTYNTSMLSNPTISTRTMAGAHTIQVQTGIWSYGLVEMSPANVLPAGGMWQTVGKLAFHVNSFNSGSNADCIDLAWNTSSPAITTAQEYISSTCQPNLFFTSYANNTTCIADSCTPLSASATAINVSCTGSNNGSIDLTVNGGTPPYTYLWSNSAVTQDISGLAPATYTVTVTDGVGGVTTATATVGPAGLTVLANVTGARCHDSDDGSIALTVAGGTGPYSYLWNDGNTSQNRVNLVPGTYSVTVTQPGGCSGVATNLVITEPGPFVYNVNPLINASCFGECDGSLDFSVSGGTPPFTYSWTEYDPIFFLPVRNLGTDEDQDSLCAGLYGVEVVDANGCVGAVFYLISEPPVIVINGNVTNADCFGAATGDINVTVTGGTQPYVNYSWTSPTIPGFSASSLSLDNELAGTYILCVTDINGCTECDTFVITQPAQILPVLGSQTNVSCFGSTNGAIDMNISGGTPPYTYSWSTGQNTQDLTGVPAGTYILTVADFRGCIGTSAPVVITQPADIVLSTVVDSVDCFGQSNGAIDLTVTGGTGTYTYLWTPGNFITQDLTGLASGTYKVVVTDVNGCKDSLTSVFVGQPADLAITVDNVGEVSCNGANDGSVSISVSGGSLPYTYAWSPGGQNTQDLTGLAGGTYTVTVTDGHGCTETTTVTVNELPAIAITLGGSTNVDCFGNSTGAIDINVAGGSGTYTYSWSPGGQVTQDLTALAAGTYTVTVTDTRNCRMSATYTITQPTQLVATLTSASNSNCNGDPTGAIDITVSGGTGPYTYVWSPGGATTQDLTNILAGFYNVTVTDDNGCTATINAIEVVKDNCPPIARNDINNTLKNTPVNGDISTNDFDPDGDVLTFTPLTTPANGAVTNFDAATGTYTYVPNNNFVGEDSYTYQVCDNGIPSLCDTATVYIEVLDNPKDPFNNPPVANADHFLTYVDVPFSSTVINNDYDPDTNDVILVNPTLITDPSNGNIVIAPNGDFTYTPNAGFTGNDTLVYSICDNGTPGPLCDTTIVVITVLEDGNRGNLPPVAVDDAYYTEINNPVSGIVTLNDYDPDGNTITVTVPQFSGPSNGTVVITPGGGFTYTPNTNYGGPDQFVYIICDNGIPSLCDTATVYIIIQGPSNLPPLARNDINNTNVNTPVSGDVSTNDEEPDGDAVTFTQLTNTSNGTVTGFNPLTGTYTYTPNNGFIGDDTFTYSICDDGTPNLCDTATVTITVIPPFNFVNNPPVANPDDYITYMNEPVSGTVIPNDFDPDVADIITVTTTLLVDPTNGTVTSINGNGTFTYVPNPGFTGDDTFVYILCDNGTPSLCDTALVTVHVLPPTIPGDNRPPVAVDDAYITEVGVAVNGNVMDNDYDPDGDAITVTVPQLSGPSNGTVAINPNGTFTYTPNAGYTGPDQFVYIICDNGVPSMCDTATAYITIYSVMSVVLTPTDVNCFGGTDGAIDATVINGTAPYTYLWSPGGQVTQDLAGIPAGTYTITVTDAFGVTVSATATVNQPTQLVASATITNVSCAGGFNGEIDLTVTGGSPAYHYLWSNGAGTQDIDFLSAGVYSVIVTDDHGCTASAAYSVNTDNALVLNTASTSATCGGANGVATVSVSGGSGAFTYAWSGSAANTASISNLTAGVYTVTVTDQAASGCSATASIQVSSIGGITVTPTVVNASCVTPNGGSIDLAVSGGTAPYTYVWGGTAASGSTAGNLAAGSYTVTVSDDNGCQEVAAITVADLPGLSIRAAELAPATCGSANGSAAALVSGGTTPYTYSWSNGQNTVNATGLAAGIYSVTAADANGCTGSATVTITNVGGPAVAVGSVTDLTCATGTTGAIAIDVTATGVATYSWSNGAITEDITGLAAGTYTVTVTDANGCVATASATVDPANAIVVIADKTNAACNGTANGAVDLTVTGGAGGYTYIWSDGPTVDDRTGLATGTYTVTVNDANGCSVSTPVIIDQPQPLNISNTTVHVTCAGGNNGSIDLTVSGGTTPYTYLWSNASTTADISTLAQGLYTVVVTDAGGCTATQTVSVLTLNTLVLNTGSTSAICGQANGAATVSVTGGSGTYTYLWSNSLATASISGLNAASYNVTVTDGVNGCTATSTVAVSNVTPMLVEVVVTDSRCGLNTGTIIATVSNGSGPYTYNWSTGPGTNVLPNLTPGNYILTVTDANGCMEIVTATVGDIPAVELLGSSVDATCGSSNGSASVTVTNGTPISIVWSNGQTGLTATNLAAGTYQVSAVDANGCAATAFVTVANANGPAITITSVTDLSCATASTGAIDIDITGGTLPYTYYWSNGEVTQDLTSLAAGTYAVTATDGNGCAASAVVTVGTPDNIVITADKTNIGCSGLPTGAIDVTVTGGVVPYTYAWSGGEITQDLASLPAGTYTVTVTDANGCSVSTPVMIEDAQPIVISNNTTNVTCEGGTNGAIDLSVSGGSTPYTYVWSNGAATADVSGLTAGLYTVLVTDANGCTAQATVSVLTENILVVNTGVTNATCGTANGQATVSVSGGSGSYTYSWTGATGATATINNLAAGSYTVIVTDAVNGCVATRSVAVSNVTTLATSVTSTDALCGASTGSAAATVTGGTAPYTYLWTGGGTTSSISNLAAGNYCVSVTDATGCQDVQCVTVNAIAGFTVSAQSLAATCGQADGSATALVTGGSGSFSFAWSNGQATAAVSNLAAGVYGVTVTDLTTGCSASTTANVGNANGPLVTIANITDLACAGSNTGAISINVASGTPAYTFTWSSGQSTEDISSLLAGIYAVTVEDANGCIGVATATVGSATDIVIVADNTAASCNGAANGSISLASGGGTGTFTYLWSDNGTGATRTGLAAGSYTVTATDANGCTATTTVTVGQPTPVAVSVDALSNVSCNSANDGAIAVSVSGGIAPYTYAWTGDTTATSEDLSGLSAGTYTLVVTDANGCTGTTGALTINEPAPLTISIASIDSINCNGDRGSVTVAVNGGTAPFTYTWTGNGTSGNGASQSGLGAGTYTVSATDANGCASDVATITFTEPAALTGTTTVTNVSCAGGNNGEIAIKVMGGSGSYTYTWSPSGPNNGVWSNLQAGTYSVTVEDANGCTLRAVAQVTSPAAIDITSQSFPDCLNNVGTINLVVLGGTAPFTYAWSDNATTEDRTGLTEATYSVTVTDANGCLASASFDIACNEPPVANRDTATTFGGTSIDIPVLNNDSDPDGDGFDVTSVTSPSNGTVTVNTDGTITYDPNDGFVGVDSFIYQICDDGTPSLCDTAMVVIVVLPERPNVQIPDGFSPNGDGYNDYFVIPDIDKYPGSQLLVFNRWGNTVWESEATGYTNKWDGKDLDEDPLPDGTYFYIITIKDGHDTKYQGFVTIHR